MNELLRFAVLGLGGGVAFLALAYGIVVIYRGSGVLNFGHGAVAMVATFLYIELIETGMSKYVALVVIMLGAGAFGVLFYLFVMRPLRLAPVLAKVVATLGLLTALQGVALVAWGTQPKIAPSLFPTSAVDLGGDIIVGSDRLYGLAGAAVLTVLLWALYSRTRFGFVTRASAESEKGAALLGYSPDLIAAANWALGCALAALAGAVIAPIAGLDTANLPLLTLPALAAALIGRFNSFVITGAVAIFIGVCQSELTNYWSDQPGTTLAVPFVLLVLAMVFTGRLIPPRGTLSEGRPPKTPSGRIHVAPVVMSCAVVVVLLAVLTPTYTAALATSGIFAILALSVVVITGYVGQISLAQMTFAGASGFMLSKATLHLGVPFPLSILLAAATAVPVGVLLGLPALRVRGINLAVVTFGVAFAATAVVFQNPKWTGGADGSPIASPALAGFSFDAVQHPTRFGLLVLGAFLLMALAVSNLRRSSTGRRLLAVRSNERAAAAAGIPPATMKLQAFGFSSFIAGLGGALLATSINQAVYGQFDSAQSITLLALVYLGGIASIAGAAIAGLIAVGGLFYVLLTDIGPVAKYYSIASGVLLILTVLTQPDGGAPLMQENLRALRLRLGGSWGRLTSRS